MLRLLTLFTACHYSTYNLNLLSPAYNRNLRNDARKVFLLISFCKLTHNMWYPFHLHVRRVNDIGVLLQRYFNLIGFACVL